MVIFLIGGLDGKQNEPQENELSVDVVVENCFVRVGRRARTGAVVHAELALLDHPETVHAGQMKMKRRGIEEGEEEQKIQFRVGSRRIGMLKTNRKQITNPGSSLNASFNSDSDFVTTRERENWGFKGKNPILKGAEEWEEERFEEREREEWTKRKEERTEADRED